MLPNLIDFELMGIFQMKFDLALLVYASLAVRRDHAQPEMVLPF